MRHPSAEAAVKLLLFPAKVTDNQDLLLKIWEGQLLFSMKMAFC